MTNRVGERSAAWLAAACALSIPSFAAVADDAAAPPAAVPAAGADDTLETVVVTAQKREQNLQDVPIAISAFTTDQLEQRGIDNVHDLNALAPGLQIEAAPSNSTISQISIRGNTTINPAIYWDPAVGIYLDGVYIGKAQGSIFDVVDLARVEVLRGPQGTLYGRNTMGGAINLVTQKPTGEFDLTGSIDYGNYNALTQKVSVDLPKWGIASFSVGARLEQRDGWVKTATGSSVSELNDRNNGAIRFAANFALAPHLQADYRFDHSDTNQNNQFGQLYRVKPALLGLPPNVNPLMGLLPYVSQDRQTQASIDAPSYERVRVQGHSLTFTWDVSDSDTVKSISAYRHLDWSDSADYDGSPLPIAQTARDTHYREWSQELQWVGHTQRWNYVGGLYYFFDDGRTNNPQSFFFGGSNYDSQYGTKTNAWAAYGQVDYSPIDPLTLTVGLRYTQEKKSIDRILGCNAAAIGCVPPAGQSFLYVVPAGTHADQTFYATTPVYSASYKLTRNASVYVRYAEGFKSGGFNGEAQSVSETETPFKPEKQKSLELGAKTTLLDDRLQFDAALFQNKAKELQESVFVGSGSAASVIRNAASATIRGIELQSAFIPIKGTKLQLNYAYLHARYDDYEDVDPTVDPTQPVNVSGNRAFVHAPANTFNAVVDSKLVSGDWGTLRGIADYAYSTSYFLYPYQLTQHDPTQAVAGDTKVKGYGVLNLRLALTQIKLGRGAIGEVALWSRNVADEKVASNFIDFGPGFGSLTDAYFIDPRTYGISGIVRW
jgi:iron complex outermembrane receptor protein